MTKPETYQKVADRYMKRFNEITSKHRMTHFRDIAGNILSGVSGYAQFIDRQNEDSKYRHKFLRFLKKIREYYKLLDKYPEFMQGELTREGAFPDLKEFIQSEDGLKQAEELGGIGFQSHYIHLAEKRLEGKLAIS